MRMVKAEDVEPLRARFLVVADHDARAQYAGIEVGRLHQLAAGRGDGAGIMAGFVFRRFAHVEDIGGARGVCAPLFDRGGIGAFDAVFLRRRFGMGSLGAARCRQALAARVCPGRVTP